MTKTTHDDPKPELTCVFCDQPVLVCWDDDEPICEDCGTGSEVGT